VNGGLIDFQDNFHRGLAEYAQLVSAQQQYGAYPPQQLAGFPAYPTMPAQVALPQTTLLGHPSFINVAGKMYKPVEEPLPATVVEVKRAPEPEPRMLTDEDIDRRVAQRVDEWAAAQRKPVPAAYPRVRSSTKPASDVERAAARVKGVNAGMYRPSIYSPV
jgi:hypothetical protein